MTLNVDAFTRDQEGELVWLPSKSDLAGFDNTRHRFYGSAKAIEAGLVLLPSLRDTVPLVVMGNDLKKPREEVLIIQKLVEPDNAEYWNFRLNNILDAITAAEQYGESGGVSIG